MVSKESLKGLSVLTLSLSLILFLVIPGLTAEFSADMVQKMKGQTQTGKIFIKEKKMRMEMNKMGGEMISIFLPDQKKTLMLMPAEKMYMEMPANAPGAASPRGQEDPAKIASQKYLGTETVNGYLCDKNEIIFRDTSMGTMTQWFSKKLGFPVKMVGQGAEGEYSTEYQNIKEGGVEDSLFQVPPGYHKMQMPGMGQGHHMPGMGQGTHQMPDMGQGMPKMDKMPKMPTMPQGMGE